MANGRSISPLIRLLPGKRSRTSIQATAVPNTACITTTKRLILDRKPKSLQHVRIIKDRQYFVNSIGEGAKDQAGDGCKDQETDVNQDNPDHQPSQPPSSLVNWG